jgi:hypothetical protein
MARIESAMARPVKASLALSAVRSWVRAQVNTELNMYDTMIVAMALVYRDILHESVTVITKNGKITHSCLIKTVVEAGKEQNTFYRGYMPTLPFLG